MSKSTGYFAYCQGLPVDYGYDDLPFARNIIESNLSVAFDEFCNKDFDRFCFDEKLDTVISMVNLLKAARELLPRIYWQYDTCNSEGVRVFRVFDGLGFSYAIFLKQSNNGDSFIVSPVAIELHNAECVFLDGNGCIHGADNRQKVTPDLQDAKAERLLKKDMVRGVALNMLTWTSMMSKPGRGIRQFQVVKALLKGGMQGSTLSAVQSAVKKAFDGLVEDQQATRGKDGVYRLRR